MAKKSKRSRAKSPSARAKTAARKAGTRKKNAKRSSRTTTQRKKTAKRSSRAATQVKQTAMKVLAGAAAGAVRAIIPPLEKVAGRSAEAAGMTNVETKRRTEPDE